MRRMSFFSTPIVFLPFYPSFNQSHIASLQNMDGSTFQNNSESSIL